MNKLWSASTTMRNPERTLCFLQTIAEMEGDIWNEDAQIKFQTLLIKNRHYTPTAKNLTMNLFSLIEDYSHNLTYEEAHSIFKMKNYVDAPMRGRTSFDPLEKLGLVSLDADDNNNLRIKITEFGRMFLYGKIDLGEMIFISLLKTQFPNPLESGRGNYNIKPFIGVLHLIREINNLCVLQNEKPVGVSREEFGIFALSLKHYNAIAKTAQHVLGFRKKKRSLPSDKERKVFVDKYIADYLKDFQNPEKNIHEYTDNIIRYLRLTRYIYIRGGGYYIDLEPRRMVEISALLENDNGSARTFSLDEYKKYISDIDAYVLPFETVQRLTVIALEIIAENRTISEMLEISYIETEMPSSTNELKTLIANLREQRTLLQNLLLKRDFQETQKIEDAIKSLISIQKGKPISGNRPSIELEKWTNIALNILNDAKLIKPNSPLGDDNEPTFTAPAGVPDIECYYDGFSAICEVTMLTARNQWYNEGQPVMRHLRSFEDSNTGQDSYCLFIAPRLHIDTINTFWIAVKYEYEGRKQRIIPITISVLIDVLDTVRRVKLLGKSFTKEHIRLLFDKCSDISGVENSSKWGEYITRVIDNWINELLTA